MRFDSNDVFFPLNLGYLSDNKIKDHSKTGKYIDISSTSGDLHQYLNFSVNFDKTTVGKYISAITDDTLGNITVAETACGSDCAECNSLECLACNNSFYLEDGICKNTTGFGYYVLTPAYDSGSSLPADIPLPQQAITTKVTVSFFIKYYANSSSSTTIDLFRYSTNLILKLVYSGTQASLTLNSNTGVISTVSNFESNFGKWVHISIAYYYDPPKVAYFPAMLNLQVNYQAITTVYTHYSGNLGINPLNMIIPKEPIALYAKIWVWDVYYNGSWAFMSSSATNADYPIPIQKFIDNQTTASCLSSTGLTINCYADYNSLLVDANYCASLSFYNGTTCLAVQATCPYGFYTTSTSPYYCSCNNKVKDMWVDTNSTKPICKSKYYSILLILKNTFICIFTYIIKLCFQNNPFLLKY